jgi:hypothetical protein
MRVRSTLARSDDCVKTLTNSPLGTVRNQWEATYIPGGQANGLGLIASLASAEAH